MRKIYNIGVLGAGSWGTTIANLLSINGHNVVLYVREDELFKEIKKTRINNIYLNGIKLSERLKFSQDVNETANKKDIIVSAIPVKFLRDTLKKISCNIEGVVISLSKGIENETFCRPSQIIGKTLGIEIDRVAALSGPNFAKEVALKLPTATVIASTNKETAILTQNAFSNSYFRVYTSNDIAGVEICGALKNIMAIASGVSDGLNLGDNARASLITRGLSEISRLGLKLGAKQETFMGLAGIGDLMLTATGSLSRNRTVGLRIAKGEKIKVILESMKMVPEGVNTTKSVYNLSKEKNIDMPITNEIYKILYEGKKPFDALKDLMNRPLKAENYLL
ncbi:NAD(P)H-dependent glycerol-3-phosphate dehydrogenase [Hippea maritima]|uniref:Glycerol-3-phosphate dehydrogenase [NAD(P)+] n=1 Tax=Hippea maritima (strain ATCC 700847 / DSM 10411 / MH2) TaxID=760142 RepID=F2LVQ3_HIPMA|nr:NAD(P)H-dependent glycerol-3-phosphate dehydrogenase [Hippea maritima]AEA33837.1 Glycerol-3-phosphate dehydrogenase (NAD(P)+) [Hippea maritima DSM 10411]